MAATNAAASFLGDCMHGGRGDRRLRRQWCVASLYPTNHGGAYHKNVVSDDWARAMRAVGTAMLRQMVRAVASTHPHQEEQDSPQKLNFCIVIHGI